jgi:hypothetical protein
VSFALAGGDAIGRMAVDYCRDALADLKAKRLSSADILGELRPIIKYVHEQYVDSKLPEDRRDAKFNLFIAIATASEDPRLYSTTDAAVTRVDAFGCLGNGMHLGRYLIEPVFERQMTINQAAILAIQALAAAKERVDGVGGRSQFLVIRDKQVSPVVAHDVNLSEPLILDYEKRTADLLLAIADSGLKDEEFDVRLRRFGHRIKDIRDSWRNQAEPWVDLMAKLARPAIKIGRKKVSR